MIKLENGKNLKLIPLEKKLNNLQMIKNLLNAKFREKESKINSLRWNA